ncbi:MAG: hypothetical protein KGL39_16930 [Patescibacteria group bacterium]|nr:hypothetical protein [Patescibacteria group bacterium]
MNSQPTPQQTLRAIMAEAMAIALLQAQDPGIQIVGHDDAEVKKRALLKLQMDQAARMALTLAVDKIERAVNMFVDWRVSELLQDGVHTFDLQGRSVEVELVRGIGDAKLKVTNVLNGAALDVAQPGGYVVFVDSRSITGEALSRWERLTGEDTKLMLLPLEVPKGQTVEQVVAAQAPGRCMRPLGPRPETAEESEWLSRGLAAVLQSCRDPIAIKRSGPLE